MTFPAEVRPGIEIITNMAQADVLSGYAAADAYMPLPFSATQGKLFSRLEAYVPPAGCLAAFVHAYYYGLALGTLLTTIVLGVATGLGVTVGFHRLFTHRSFETSRFVRAALAILGCTCAQGHLYLWVATHRRHHRFSDHHGDPHSPNLGGQTRWSRWRDFLHAHFGWSLEDELTDEALQYIPDLTSDPLLHRIQRLHLLWVAIGLAIPAAILYAINGTLQAAIGGFLWGGCVRLTSTNQATYAVNSVCHIWGERPFESSDLSRNNRWVAFASLGEGWHNNHHAFPTSARHGLRPGEHDLSWSFIKLLRRCGLAWNVKTPTLEQMNVKARVQAAEPCEEDAIATCEEAPAFAAVGSVGER